MLTGRGQLVLLLGAGLYLAAWGFGIREAYAVALALALAPLVALALVRGARSPGAIRRSVGGGRSEGDPLEVRVELPVEGRAPRALTLVDDTPTGPRRVRLVRDGAVLAGAYAIAALPRGAYTLSGARVVREDPFGLADGSSAVGGEHALLVRPRVSTSAGRSPTAACSASTAGAASSGAGRATTSTRCASTSRATPCGACTGARRRAASS